MVSKKSLSMIVKMASTAPSTPVGMVKMPPRSWTPSPIVLKLTA